MAADSSSLWDQAGVSHVDFHTNLWLISAACGGDGANLQNYISKSLSQTNNHIALDKLRGIYADSEASREFHAEHGDEFEADAQSTLSAGCRTDIQLGPLMDKFLDRVAEFASTRHGGEHVVSSAFENFLAQEDSGTDRAAGDDRHTNKPIRLLLAKNGPFVKAERDFLCKDFPRMMRNVTRGYYIGKQEEIDQQQNMLWQAMCQFTRHRTVDEYIRNFIEAYTKLKKSGKSKIQPLESAILAELQLLSALCPKIQKSPKDLSNLVEEAYKLRSSQVVKTVYDHASQYSSAYKVVSCVMFLGRARAAFEVFIKICATVSSFEYLEVECIEPLTSDLHRAQLRGIERCLQVISSMNTNKKRISKASGWHKKYSTSKLHVHCEIQLAVYMSRCENTYSYIGGSKRPCFLCYCFLVSLGTRIRPSHGGFYVRWTLPSLSSTTAKRSTRDMTVRFSDAILKLDETVQAIIVALQDNRNPREYRANAQSSAGVTASDLKFRSDVPSRQRPSEYHQSEILKIKTQEQTRFDMELESDHCSPGRCQICDATTTRTCSTCGDGHFCCKGHELQYHPSHATACLPRMLSDEGQRPRFCSVCGGQRVFSCRQCLSSSYCSPACYTKDRELHCRLSFNFSISRFSRPQLGPEYRLCIYLPENSQQAQIVWIMFEKQYEEELGYESWEYLRIDYFLGEHLRPLYVTYDSVAARALDREILVYAREAFLIDGSADNICVDKLAGHTAHTWKGSIIITRAPLQEGWSSRSMTEDVRMEDLTAAVNYLRTYSDTISEDLNVSSSNLLGEKRDVVRINCDQCLEIYDWPRFEKRKMQDHPSFGSIYLDCGSEIAHKIGVPLRLFHKRPDFIDQIDVEKLDDSFMKQFVEPLHQIIDLKNTDQWGLVDPRLYWKWELVGNCIVYRTDKGELTPKLVEHICRFCKDVERFLQHTRVKKGLSKSQAVAAICAENFRRAVQQYECGRDAWTSEMLAPWEI